MTYAQITDEGRTLIEEIFPDHSQRIHELMDVLVPEEKQTAIDLLKKLGLSVGKY